MLRIIKQWWKTFTMSPTEKYLASSKDIHQLERRLQELKYKGIWL